MKINLAIPAILTIVAMTTGNYAYQAMNGANYNDAFQKSWFQFCAIVAFGCAILIMDREKDKADG